MFAYVLSHSLLSQTIMSAPPSASPPPPPPPPPPPSALLFPPLPVSVSIATKSISLEPTSSRHLDLLRKLTGSETSTWNPGQEQGLSATLRYPNALVVIPTGAGKTALYAVPALAAADEARQLRRISPSTTRANPITIVVVPLVSLVAELQTRLEAAQLKVLYWRHASCSDPGHDDPSTRYEYGVDLSVILVVADTAATERFILAMRSIEPRIQRIVIDEVHSIVVDSRWRYSFVLLRQLRTLGGHCLLLTATLPPVHEHRVLTALDLPDSTVVVRVSSLRRNLQFETLAVSSADRGPRSRRAYLDEAIKRQVQQNQTEARSGKIIVFVDTVQDVDSLVTALNDQDPGIALGYHAQLGPKGRKRTKAEAGEEEAYTNIPARRKSLLDGPARDAVDGGGPAARGRQLDIEARQRQRAATEDCRATALATFQQSPAIHQLGPVVLVVTGASLQTGVNLGDVLQVIFWTLSTRQSRGGDLYHHPINVIQQAGRGGRGGQDVARVVVFAPTDAEPTATSQVESPEARLLQVLLKTNSRHCVNAALTAYTDGEEHSTGCDRAAPCTACRSTNWAPAPPRQTTVLVRTALVNLEPSTTTQPRLESSSNPRVPRPPFSTASAAPTIESSRQGVEAARMQDARRRRVLQVLYDVLSPTDDRELGPRFTLHRIGHCAHCLSLLLLRNLCLRSAVTLKVDLGSSSRPPAYDPTQPFSTTHTREQCPAFWIAANKYNALNGKELARLDEALRATGTTTSCFKCGLRHGAYELAFQQRESFDVDGECTSGIGTILWDTALLLHIWARCVGSSLVGAWPGDDRAR